MSSLARLRVRSPLDLPQDPDTFAGGSLAWVASELLSLRRK